MLLQLNFMQESNGTLVLLPHLHATTAHRKSPWYCFSTKPTSLGDLLKFRFYSTRYQINFDLVSKQRA